MQKKASNQNTVKPKWRSTSLHSLAKIPMLFLKISRLTTTSPDILVILRSKGFSPILRWIETWPFFIPSKEETPFQPHIEHLTHISSSADAELPHKNKRATKHFKSVSRTQSSWAKGHENLYRCKAIWVLMQNKGGGQRMLGQREKENSEFAHRQNKAVGDQAEKSQPLKEERYFQKSVPNWMVTMTHNTKVLPLLLARYVQAIWRTQKPRKAAF